VSGKQDYSRILLIRRKALGDSLVTMRAVLEVVRAWPTATIDLVIDRPFAGLMEGLAGRTDGSGRLRVLTWPPDGEASWVRVLRNEGYELVIDWLGSPRTALWTILTGAAVRVGYDLPRRRWAYNVRVPRNQSQGRQLRGFAGEAFLDPLRCLGVVPAPWRDGFAAEGLAEDNRADLSGIFRTWLEGWIQRPGLRVVMMMSATWSAKGWPAEKAVTLFQALCERGYDPVFVTGPGDEQLEADLRAHLPEDAFAPPTNLLELAHLLGKAHLFVGTDCGPRHLAASLGVSTVTLFGPTDPVGWNPAAPEHVSVRTGVDCSPCDLAECPVPGHPCMANLNPGLVLEAVDRVLGKGSN
jgi:ADP-heptose:LPS heptosyltransferase